MHEEASNVRKCFVSKFGRLGIFEQLRTFGRLRPRKKILRKKLSYVGDQNIITTIIKYACKLQQPNNN